LFPALSAVPAATARAGAGALVGSFDELSTAARAGLRVSRAVFPLLDSASPFLPPSRRDALWEMFEVPVYALVLDRYRKLIGYECEAQSGIHLCSNHCFPAVHIDPTLCECGRSAPRLMPEADATLVILPSDHSREAPAGATIDSCTGELSSR
jgi:hypothetical protein